MKQTPRCQLIKWHVTAALRNKHRTRQKTKMTSLSSTHDYWDWTYWDWFPGAVDAFLQICVWIICFHSSCFIAYRDYVTSRPWDFKGNMSWTAFRYFCIALEKTRLIMAEQTSHLVGETWQLQRSKEIEWPPILIFHKSFQWFSIKQPLNCEDLLLFLFLICDDKWSESLGFGLLVGRKKRHEDIDLGSGKLWQKFLKIVWHLTDWLIVNMTGIITDFSRNRKYSSVIHFLSSTACENDSLLAAQLYVERFFSRWAMEMIFYRYTATSP